MTDDSTNPPVKQCSKCHETKPATAEFFNKKAGRKYGLRSECKACQSSAHAAYYATHREKKAAYQAAHHEERQAAAIVYRNSHREELKAYHAAYNAVYQVENHDRMRVHYAAYRAEHRDQRSEYNSAYRASNRDKGRAQTARRRAIQRSLPATFTQLEWTRCLEHFGYCCAYCGRPQGLWHTMAQDHYIPASRGGGYTASNIVPACHGVDGCNNRKNNHTPHEWLVWAFGPRKAARIERRIQTYFASLSGGNE